MSPARGVRDHNSNATLYCSPVTLSDAARADPDVAATLGRLLQVQEESVYLQRQTLNEARRAAARNMNSRTEFHEPLQPLPDDFGHVPKHFPFQRTHLECLNGEAVCSLLATYHLTPVMGLPHQRLQLARYIGLDPTQLRDWGRVYTTAPDDASDDPYDASYYY